MTPGLLDHLARVLPDVCAGGIDVTASELAFIVLGSHVVRTAEVDGVVRAHAEGRRNPVSPHRWTVSCAVERDFQGRGLGRKVLSEVLQYVDAQGAEYVDGNAWASNTRVLALDESLGFRRVGLVPDAYRRDGISYDQVILVRGRAT